MTAEQEASATTAVLYAHLARDGGIFLVDATGVGAWAPSEAFRAHLRHLAAARGRLLYTREQPEGEPTAQQVEAFEWVSDAGVEVVVSPQQHPSTVLTGGVTPLMAASYAGDALVVADLLGRGADPNVADQVGYTPLMYAARGGHADVATSLLRAGARVDMTDRNGATPLLFAAQGGSADVVRLLLDAGADPAAADGAGRTAAAVAGAIGADEVLRVLDESAGDTDPDASGA